MHRRSYVTGGDSRLTVDVAALFPEARGRLASAVVTASGRVVVELSRYWDAEGVRWSAGTTSKGRPSSDGPDGPQSRLRMSRGRAPLRRAALLALSLWVPGVAFDPELIDFGVHATFAPIFIPGVEFRPGVELGLGELTTRWLPYIGGGPNFVLSRRSFEADQQVDGFNRFDFSDTDFNGGFKVIAGARHQNGAFLELRATAWGVAAVRLLAGFNF